MHKSLNIRFSLSQDMDDFARYMLDKGGFKYKENNRFDIYFQAMNTFRRTIPNLPRSVVMAPNVNCPEHLRDGFNVFCSNAISGSNLNFFLSHNIRRSIAQDTLFNTFGLHHFHLGDEKQNTGKYKHFYKRTGYIAIALINEQAIYIVDICRHGEDGDPNVWFDPRYIETIHENWPLLIERWKTKGIVALVRKYTNTELSELIKLGLNVSFQMDDGTVYMTPGGGITCAKTSLDQQMAYDRDARYILWAVEYLSYNLSREPFDMWLWPIKLKFRRFSSGIHIEDKTNKQSYIITEMKNKQIKTLRFSNHIIYDHIFYDLKRLTPISSAIRSIKCCSDS